jgi:hypothetical protein
MSDFRCHIDGQPTSAERVRPLCSARNRIVPDFLLTFQAATFSSLLFVMHTAQDGNSEAPNNQRRLPAPSNNRKRWEIPITLVKRPANLDCPLLSTVTLLRLLCGCGHISIGHRVLQKRQSSTRRR